MSTRRRLQRGASLARVLILLGLAALNMPAFGAACDVDSDGDIDRLDLEAIFAARNQPASGADDPRDEDANGFITVLDGRACVHRCAVARCEITEPNKAPVLAEIPPQVVAEGETASVPVSATDEDGDDLAFSIESLPGFATFTDHADGSATLELAPGYTDAGEYAIQLSVADPRHTVSQTVNISVTNSNRLPELTVPPIHTVKENEQLTITASATDPDNEALTYTVSGLPAFGSFTDHSNGTATIVLSPGFEAAGPYTITLTVTDTSGDSRSADLAVTVTNVNRSPVILSQPVVSATGGESYVYPVAAEDPDDDLLQFTLTVSPLGMTIGDVTGQISWIPGRAQVGQQDVSVTVSDGQGGDAVQTFSVDVIAGPDRESPYVELVVPEEVVAGGILKVVALAEDDTAVEKVSFYIDELLAGEVTVAPYRIDFNAPDQTGPPVHVRAVAVDTAGNAGADDATVTVVLDEDLTQPVIESVMAPASAAAGEDVTIKIVASDERGVEEISIELDGAVVATLTTPPYEAILTIPATAAIGSELVYVITARDAAGNAATAEARITVDDAPDNTPPGPVTVQVPATGVPGQSLAVTASAVDDTGILQVDFLANDVPFHAAAAPPYDARLEIPADAPPGSQIQVTATARDFSGNTTNSAASIVLVVEAAAALLTGEVYDDATGLPLADALVRAWSPDDTMPDPLGTAVSDGRGRFTLELLEGPVLIGTQRGGYTPVARTATLQPGVVNSVLDFRLTPMVAPVAVDPRTGTELAVPGLNAEVHIPAGALAAPAELHATPLSGQGLRARLPAGWTPVGAFHLGPENLAFVNPVTVSFGSIPANVIAAHWDAAQHAWVRLPLTAVEGRQETLLAAPGGVALLRPDTSPQAPPLPAAGAVIEGVAAVPLPVQATALLSPSPEVLFMQPGARSGVDIELRNVLPLPSGMPSSVAFSETYRRTDGSLLIPPPTRQDIVLYQRDTGYSGHFIATPSQLFDPALLTQGVIHLAALDEDRQAGQAVVGSSGGTVTSTGGITLTLPPGALAGTTAVTLAPLAGLPDGVVDPAAFEWIAGVEIDLGPEPLSLAATLHLPAGSALPAGARVLATRSLRVNDASRLQLVGVGTATESGVDISAGALGLALPGVDRSGGYHFFLVHAPQGFVTGTVTGGAVEAGQVLVQADKSPFVSLVDGSAVPYVLALPVGDGQVQADDLDTGRNAADIATVTAADDIVTLDLELGEARPTVVQVIPANGATGVATTSSITVRFSQTMDAATLTADTVSLSTENGPVAGSLSLQADGSTAVFQPSSLLASETRYTLLLAAGVKDAFGVSLLGNQPDDSYSTSFTTVDVTPPPGPEAGQISLSIPYEGVTRISATQGTVEPGTIVTATNTTTATNATVIANIDGSFSVVLDAALSDAVVITFRDEAGNETTFDPGPFRDADGTVIMGSAGGVVEGPEGSRVVVPPGAIPDGTPVRLDTFTEADLPVPVPEEIGFEFLGGVSLYMNGVVASEELKLSIPKPAASDITEEAQIVVLQEREFFGETRYSLVNIAKLNNGIIETASPPFPGVDRDGDYVFGKAKVEIRYEVPLIQGLGVGGSAVVETSGLWDVWSAGRESIFAVPVNREFSYSVYQPDTGQLIATVTGDPVPVPAGSVTTSPVCTQSAAALNIVDIRPERNQGAVQIHSRIDIEFDNPVDPDVAEQKFRVIRLDSNGRETGAPLQRDDALELVDESLTFIRFRPKRRLHYNTTYKIDVSGVQALCGSSTPSESSILFSTFSPEVVGSTSQGDLAEVNDVAEVNDSTVVVANGNIDGNDMRGAALIDISDRENPVYVVEPVFEGRTAALHDIKDVVIEDDAGNVLVSGNIVLAVNAGTSIPSNLRVLEASSSTLKSVAAQLLSTDLDSLANGVVLANVPPLTGLPRSVVNLGNNAYVATTGIGIEGVRLADAFHGANNRVMPGVYACEACNSVGVVRDTILAGDSKNLVLLEPDLDVIGVFLRLPARFIQGVSNYTADVNSDGLIDQDTEVFDLAFVLGQDRKLYIVNLTQLSSPEIMTAIPFNAFLKSVEIDREDRLAYVSTQSQVFILDISLPTEGDPDGRIVDADSDGVDDRILGEIGSLPGAGSLALSTPLTYLYVGDQAGRQMHVARVKPGRLYVDYADSEFSDVKIEPQDYYPSLGKRLLNVRAFNVNGTPGAGDVSAELVAAPDSVSIESSVTLVDGLAKFHLDAHELTPKDGSIRIEFKWVDDANEELVTQTTLSIRNNSNTYMQEVLDGKAVFVVSPKTARQIGKDGKSEHYGITKPVNVDPPSGIDSGYEVKVASAAAPEDQEFDVLEEMLNQVVLRNRDALRHNYRPVIEDGLYDREVKTAITEFRNAFDIPQDQRSRITQKMVKDYELDRDDAKSNRYLTVNNQGTELFDDASIVDQRDLIRDEGSAFDGEHRCFGQLTRFGSSCQKPDAGLYELYANVVRPFIEEKIKAMELYTDYIVPDNTNNSYVLRQSFAGEHVRIPPSNQLQMAMWDGKNAVSYSYGSYQYTREVAQHFLQHYQSNQNLLDPLNVFEDSVTSLEPPEITFSGEIKPQDTWLDLNGNSFTVLSGEGNWILPIGFPPYLGSSYSTDGVVEAGKKKLYTDLLSTEFTLSIDGFLPPASAQPEAGWAVKETTLPDGSTVIESVVQEALEQYKGRNWAGIDCSALATVSFNYARLLPDVFDWTLPLFPNIPAVANPATNRRDVVVQTIAVNSYPRVDESVAWFSLVGAIRGDFGIPATTARKTGWNSIRRGDLVLQTGHVATAYDDNKVLQSGRVVKKATDTKNSDFLVIHALGTEWLDGEGVKKFGKHVVVTPRNGNMSHPSIAVREILW